MGPQPAKRGRSSKNGSGSAKRKRTAVSSKAKASSSATKVYCYCQKAYDERSMVACDGKDCIYEWVHFDCAGLEEAPEGEWFCFKCVKKSSYPVPPSTETQYCYCRCPYDEVSEMISCSGNDCEKQWFHLECLNMQERPKEKWLCADCKKRLN